jgi:serine/threonine protein kinase
MFTAKLCDFGLSRSNDSIKTISSIKGTPAYMAPEIYEHAEYSEESDVYAFGIVMNEVLTENIPYQDDSPMKLLEPQQIMFQVSIKKIRPNLYKPTSLVSYVDEILIKMIQQCWNQDKNERYKFSFIHNTLQYLFEMEAKATANAVSSMVMDVKKLKNLFESMMVISNNTEIKNNDFDMSNKKIGENNKMSTDIDDNHNGFDFQEWVKRFLKLKKLIDENIDLLWKVLEVEGITDIEMFTNSYKKKDFSQSWFEKRKIESKALQSHFLSMHDEALKLNKNK